MADTRETPKKKSGILAWMKRFLNLYTLAGIVVILFIVFGGENTVFTNIDDNRLLDSLQNELQATRDSTEYYRQLNRRLQTDTDLMEQIVREHYRMQKETEDAFVFDENP